MVMEAALSARWELEQPTLQTIENLFRIELKKLGLEQRLDNLQFPLTNLELRQDTYANNQSFFGQWINEAGEVCGSVVIHGSGELFAECDVLIAHPTQPKWFIESITVWGSRQQLNSELSLLPAVAD